jgi:PAS domain S-box-containing protein
MWEDELTSYWKTIVDTIHEGLMVVDRGGTIVTVNRSLEEMTGFSRDELVGRSCTSLNCDTCAFLRHQESDRWCVLFRQGSLKKQRCVLTRKDGSRLHVLKNASILRDGRGEAIGGVETMTDVTEIMEKNTQIEAYRRELQSEQAFHGIIGVSSEMQQVFDLISSAGQSEAPVLIYGESGTGKELVARAVHEGGHKRKRPYVKVNCAALNESLIESELFGHVKGAFTGAHRDRKGRFEAARSGSIFLDEIGDLPASVQVKLLRVLEEKAVERVGDHQPIEVDVRIITATNKDLSRLVAEGSFREDLFYRINVIPIHVPPLRDRVGDVPVLAEHFFRKIKRSNRSGIEGIGTETVRLLLEYSWPGNVRELRSALEYAFVACHEERIQPYHLPVHIFRGSEPKKEGMHDTDEIKRKELIEALRRSGGKRGKAAEILGVSRVTVWNRMRKYGVTVEAAIAP